MSDEKMAVAITTHTAADFTDAEYHALVNDARKRFRFCRLTDDLSGDNQTIWRHDVDFSPHRALAAARTEAAAGVASTYFVLIVSPFYNLFEDEIGKIFREIAKLGHDIGLHYDAGSNLGSNADHVDRMLFEANTLGNHLGIKVSSFSLHNPSVRPDVKFEEMRYAGLINASAPGLRAEFTYVSDSNGIWRYRSLRDVLNDPAVTKLYALTHPEWWTPTPMAPHARVQRCIDGRTRRVAEGYRAFLAQHRPELLND